MEVCDDASQFHWVDGDKDKNLELSATYLLCPNDTLRGLKKECFLISINVVKRVLLEYVFKGVT